MKLEQCPVDLRDYLIPVPTEGLNYHCLKCGVTALPDRLYYTCPACGGLLLLEDDRVDRFKEHSGEFWRRLFDYRRLLNKQPLRGIFTFYEFLIPLLDLTDIVYLGEGHTPLVAAPSCLMEVVGLNFFIKHDGQNPSASFKDRGMAAALSYLKYLRRTRGLTEVLAICASTGDTSAAAALYVAALGEGVKSAVLLPRGKVTLPQMGQSLGAGARVFELPGVFDDCMKVVEYLSERFEVALLNSKNPWRVLGQESYAFELAQEFDYELDDLVLMVPVGNAGNLTAILSGLLKLYRYGIIEYLPKVGAVQSEHADPVFCYYDQKIDPVYRPVTVRPSVAQAAMIGDPVSFPRVVKIVADYRRLAGEDHFFVVQVKEDDIMENMILANRSGLTVCTQGGETLAGLRAAMKLGLVSSSERAVVDSTAHALKFAEFQNAYFEGALIEGYGITTNPVLINRPLALDLVGVSLPRSGETQNPADRAVYVAAAAEAIAKVLGLTPGRSV